MRKLTKADKARLTEIGEGFLLMLKITAIVLAGLVYVEISF